MYRRSEVLLYDLETMKPHDYFEGDRVLRILYKNSDKNLNYVFF